jgi:uncharacterized membrane protein YedE/YeeE
MRRYFLTAPRWVLAIIYGAFFGIGMSLFGFGDSHSSLGGRLFGAILAGVLFGVIMGPLATRRRERARAAAGDLTDAEFLEAARTSPRDAVPDEPRVREGAERLLQFRLDEYSNRRPRDLLILAAAAVGYALAGIFISPGWAVGTLVFGFALAAQFLVPARLTRRLHQLHTAP